ncbi:MAG TPA: DUF2244 domain-containing protein [Rubrivivax sp.]
MTATLAPNPWLSPAAFAGRPLRFGSPWIGADRVPGVKWVLRRNCSTTPAELANVYILLCLSSLLIAAGFAFAGATVVLAFAGLELLLVGVAFLVYARHARDGDTLTLAGQSLAVEQAQGSRTRLTEFRVEWLAVEPSHGEGSLLELSGQGQRVRIARHVRPELRSALASELRLALRSARQAVSTAPASPAFPA